MTPEEEAQLLMLAQAQHVSVPRLLIEAALSGGSEAAAQRRELVQVLFGTERLLANIANNVNQIAHTFNIAAKVVREGAAPDDRLLSDAERDVGRIGPLLEKIRETAERIEDALEELSVEA